MDEDTTALAAVALVHKRALRDPRCPFWCTADAAQRLVLLEIASDVPCHADDATALSGVAGARRMSAPSAIFGAWRVEARVAACWTSSVRLRIGLLRATSSRT